MNKKSNLYNRARRENVETADSRTKNRQSRAQVDAMARRAFGGVGLAGEAAALEELQDGWFNAVDDVALADGRRVILKIAPPPGAEVMTDERGPMATEVATMRLARANPLVPVPAVLHHDGSCTLCDSPWFFMERVACNNLDRVRGMWPPEASRASTTTSAIRARAVGRPA
jgi:aminoglycoside phosphotransferase (APT) family kinase protein